MTTALVLATLALLVVVWAVFAVWVSVACAQMAGLVEEGR